MTYNHYFSRTHGRKTHNRGSNGEGDNSLELFGSNDLESLICESFGSRTPIRDRVHSNSTNSHKEATNYE